VWGPSIAEAKCARMPDTIHDLRDLIDDILEGFDDRGTEGWVEYNTGYMAGMRVSPKSMFSFGKNTGRIEMGLAAANVPYREIQPAAWMRRAGLSATRRSVSTTAAWKKHLKEEAQKKFPYLSRDVTLKTADAFLLYYAIHSTEPEKK